MSTMTEVSLRSRIDLIATTRLAHFKIQAVQQLLGYEEDVELDLAERAKALHEQSERQLTELVDNLNAWVDAQVSDKLERYRLAVLGDKDDDAHH